MLVNGKIYQRVTIELDCVSAIEAILQDLKWNDDIHSFVCVENYKGVNSLVSKSDHSYHGSPDYQVDSVLSTDPKDIELYQQLCNCLEILKEREK